MEHPYGRILQAGVDVTGRADVTLKTTPAAGSDDFWGGALRVPRQCAIQKGKAVLHLEDGRVGHILIDSLHDDEGDNSRIVTFLGYTPLQRSNPQVTSAPSSANGGTVVNRNLPNDV